MATNISITQQTAQAAGQAALAGGKPGLLGGQASGANFMDMIFATVTAQQPAKPAQPILFTAQPSQMAPAKAFALGVKTTIETVAEPVDGLAMLADLSADEIAAMDLSSLQKMLAGSDIPAVTAAVEGDIQPMTPEGKHKLLATLQTLLNGTPGKKADFAAIAAQLAKSIDGKPLEGRPLTAPRQDGDAAPALIAVGLTPEQITATLKDIAENKEPDATILAAIMQIMPVPAKAEAVVLTRGPAQGGLPSVKLAVLAAEKADKPGAINQPAPKTATVNAMIGSTNAGGTNAGGTDAGGANAVNTSKSANVEASTSATAGDFKGFDSILKMFADGQQPEGTVKMPTIAEQAAARATALTAGNSVVSNHVNNGNVTQTMNTLLASASPESIFPDGMGWYPDSDMASAGTIGAGLSVGLPLNGPAPAASPIGYAPNAAMPHPATATIAATILKGAADGETKINLRLDPPELGRVNIKLEFSRHDKTVKAVISAEKPETYMMMQRDQQVLQRALNDAGMDTGANGLTFELAQDGNAFGERNQRGGNDSGGGDTGFGTEYAKDIHMEEMTMDWSVDRGTGLMHYDVLA